MESKDENQDEKQFMELWGAYEYDKEYTDMRKQQRARRKECEDLVDLCEFMTAKMDEYERDDEENEEEDMELEDMEERVLTWMNYGGETEEENRNEVMNGEEEEEQPWLDREVEVEEAALPQLRNIVQTIGKTTPDIETACHRIKVPYPASLWIPGLHPETHLTEMQATGVAWTLDRLETVQGALLTDEQGLGREVTALAVLLVQNDDRAAGKSIWGEAKPTLIVTSFTGISTWIDVMRTHLDDIGYDIRYLISTLNGTDLCRDEIQKQVGKMKANREDPAKLIYVVDGELIPGCSDLKDCFGLKVIDEPGALNETELFEAIKAIECPYTLHLTSTPPLTRNLDLANYPDLINPDSKWDELSVAYSQNPFDFDENDPRGILKATKRAVRRYLGSGAEQKDSLQEILKLIMLRREELDVSSSEENDVAHLDDVVLTPNSSFIQSCEAVEKLLKITLDSVAVTNTSTKKRRSDDEIAKSPPKKSRQDGSTQIQSSFSHTIMEDATTSAAEPSGMLSSIWRRLQFWK